MFDVFATAVEVAGGTPAADLDAVSLSLLPILTGGALPTTKLRELYFVRREGGPTGGKSYEALVRGEWKLMQNNPYSPLELYNLKNDPHEDHNVIAQNPAIANELKAALRFHIQRGGATPWQPPAATKPILSVQK